jgi:hypothetical protein
MRLLFVGIKRYARRFLRDIRSKRWLTAAGTFSRDIQEALEVHNFTEAHKVARRHQAKRLELVLKFPNEEDDVALPLE